MRSSARSKNATFGAAVGVLGIGSIVRAARRSVVAKPGSTLRETREALDQQARADEDITASAISLTTRAPRIHRRLPPPLRPAAFSVSTRSGRDAEIAGARPKTSAVRIECPGAERQHRRADADVARSRHQIGIGGDERRRRPPRNGTPSTPPAIASTTLSVSSCWMMRPRPAPIAVRTAISRSRKVARARCMFARFAHATSNTSPTAPAASPALAGRCRPQLHGAT